MRDSARRAATGSPPNGARERASGTSHDEESPERRVARGSRQPELAGYSLFFAVLSAFALVARCAFRFDLEAVLDLADFAEADLADFLAMAVESAFFACCCAA